MDWHNYGYTILALSDPPRVVIRFAHWVERFFGSRGSAHLCVTHAMREDLNHSWGVQAETLHDRPPEHFRPTPLEEQHALFQRLGEACPGLNAFDIGMFSSQETPWTKCVGGRVELKEEAPPILVSSTSWTPDEDFGVLLEALKRKC